MKRLLALVAAASLLLPTVSMAQNPPKGNNNNPKQHTRTNKTTTKTITNKTVTTNKVTTTNRRAGNIGPARYRPLPPRGNQFYHRGQYYSRIRGPVYAYPRGWHYRHWGIGGILPAVLFASTFYYVDYAVLGLQAPAPGYQWVRFGPDLLLVNLATGQVEDVVYGAFL
ncbi:MAG: RcnB family protein [Stellaceae bacterium]